MHFILACSVQIGDLNASPFIHEVEVRSGWKDLTDMAKVTIPKKLLTYGLAEINAGEPVTISVGYESYVKEVFNGYVKQVNPKTPLEVECEDASYLLKRTSIQKFWPTEVTFKEVVNHLVTETNSANPNFPITLNDEFIPDITFKKFRIGKKVNAAQALEKFKEAYGVIAYFRDHELHVSLAGFRPKLNQATYDLTQNVIDHSKLEYRTIDQNNIKLKAVSLLKDNQFIEVEVGDESGSTVQRFFPGITSESALKQLAEEEIKRIKFEGYRGTIKSFMVPFSQHGMTALIQDPDYGSNENNELRRSGTYDIDSTVLKFGDGITIDVEIGLKV